MTAEDAAKELFEHLNGLMDSSSTLEAQQAVKANSEALQRLVKDLYEPGVTREQRRTLLKEQRRLLELICGDISKEDTDVEQIETIEEQKSVVRDQELTIETLEKMFEDKRIKDAVKKLVNSEIERIQLEKDLKDIKEETKRSPSLEAALAENRELWASNAQLTNMAKKYQAEKQAAEKEVEILKRVLERTKNCMARMAEGRREIQEKAAEVSERDLGTEAPRTRKLRELVEEQNAETKKLLERLRLQ